MRKFFIFVIFIICFILIGYTKTDFVTLFGQLASENVSYSAYGKFKDKDNLEDVKMVDAGMFKIATFNFSNFNLISGNDIQGYSLSMYGDETIYQQLINKYCEKMVKKDIVMNRQIVYGYNSKLKNSVNIDSKKCNLQFIYENGRIMIANPIMLGSF